MKYMDWQVVPTEEVDEAEIERSCILVNQQTYRWSDRVTDGCGVVAIWFDPQKQTFWRSQQEGVKGHGKLVWCKDVLPKEGRA